MPEGRLLGAVLRWALEAGLRCLWLFSSYRIWADPSLFPNCVFPQLTPRNSQFP